MRDQGSGEGMEAHQVVIVCRKAIAETLEDIE